ncbi:hypothetical protein AM593_06809, partial [Mytilus galloprovincialis]
MSKMMIFLLLAGLLSQLLTQDMVAQMIGSVHSIVVDWHVTQVIVNGGLYARVQGVEEVDVPSKMKLNLLSLKTISNRQILSNKKL